MKCNKGYSAYKLYAANTALVFHIECATDDDLFGIEYSPFDEQSQCMDDLKFYPVLVKGERVTFDNKTSPFVYTTPAKAYYRIVNLGFDNTRACVNIIDTYEVKPYVER